MPKTHANYIFSVTIKTDELAVLACLRSLSLFSQQSGNNRMPAYAATDRLWLRDSNESTFRFTRSDYRAGFLLQANRLLPNTLFEVVREDDNDPASMQA